jgi:G3E family GTPase
MTESSRIPYTILGGYLGAGKTTLLNRLLADNQGLRLALLINDFGAINIDAELISERTDNQISLTNGCICCGLSAGFDEAIESLLQRMPPPDRILVEASGVADVISLSQYGHHPGLMLDAIIVVADAETVRTKARDRYVADTVTRQLRGADLIILNKVDLVSNPEAVIDWLEGLAPGTPVVPARYCGVPVNMLLGLEPRSHQATPASLRPQAEHHRGHEEYATWHYRTDTPLQRDRVDAFVAAMPTAVLRAKGFFRLDSGQRLVFQQVGGRRTLELTDTPGDTELVAIGLAVDFPNEILDRNTTGLTV